MHFQDLFVSNFLDDSYPGHSLVFLLSHLISQEGLDRSCLSRTRFAEEEYNTFGIYFVLDSLGFGRQPFEVLNVDEYELLFNRAKVIVDTLNMRILPLRNMWLEVADLLQGFGYLRSPTIFHLDTFL